MATMLPYAPYGHMAYDRLYRSSICRPSREPPSRKDSRASRQADLGGNRQQVQTTEQPGRDRSLRVPERERVQQPTGAFGMQEAVHEQRFGSPARTPRSTTCPPASLLAHSTGDRHTSDSVIGISESAIGMLQNRRNRRYRYVTGGPTESASSSWRDSWN